LLGNSRRFPETAVTPKHPKLDHFIIETHGFGDSTILRTSHIDAGISIINPSKTNNNHQMSKFIGSFFGDNIGQVKKKSLPNGTERFAISMAVRNQDIDIGTPKKFFIARPQADPFLSGISACPSLRLGQQRRHGCQPGPENGISYSSTVNRQHPMVNSSTGPSYKQHQWLNHRWSHSYS